MLAREGWPVVAGLAAVAGAAGYYTLWWSVPPLLLLLAALRLYRARSRRAVGDPLDIHSPADGEITGIQAVDDPWVDRQALRIGLRLPFPGITVVYSPATGKVRDYWTDLGAQQGRLEAERGAAREQAERKNPEDIGEEASWDSLLESPTHYALALETDAEDCIIYCVSSLRPHSRLKFDQAPGERAAKGQRSGFVYFASRIDVLLPLNSRAEVSLGQRVLGGSTVVATLVRS